MLLVVVRKFDNETVVAVLLNKRGTFKVKF